MNEEEEFYDAVAEEIKAALKIISDKHMLSTVIWGYTTRDQRGAGLSFGYDGSRYEAIGMVAQMQHDALQTTGDEL